MYIKDENTLLLKNFEYDGKGPDAYFYVGLHGEPSGIGAKLNYPSGDHASILPEFSGEDVEIELPEGYEASKLMWFSVWCRQFMVSFGDVYFEGQKNAFNSTEMKGTGWVVKCHGSIITVCLVLDFYL